MPRRRYQIGPTHYSVAQGAHGFHVEANWHEATRQGGQEHFSERVTGPMPQSNAVTKAAEMNTLEAVAVGQERAAGGILRRHA